MLPTHDPQWRARWNLLTDALESSLDKEEPTAEETIELLRQRQRLLSAVKKVKTRDLVNDIPGQIQWLQSMQERDAILMERVSALIEAKSRSLESYRANKRALKALRRKSISPQRHYIVTGHL